MKYLPRVVLLLISVIVTTAAIPAYSFQIAFGGTTWYSKWEPAWAYWKFRVPATLTGDFPPVPVPIKLNDFTSDMSFLYGPMLMIGFDHRWSVASVFMYGRFEFVSNGPRLTGFGYLGDTRYRKKIEKYDSDSTLNCQVNRYFRLFLGFKYQGYTYRENMWFANFTEEGALFARNARDVMRNLGLGLGLGFNIPLIENFYVLINGSASFLFGQEHFSFQHNYFILIGDSGVQQNPTQYRKSNFYAIAGNSSLSFAYYISKANISLSLGFRYQVLYFIQPNTGWKYYYEFAHYDGKYDHFYGIVLSAVYSIKFGKDKPDETRSEE
ncbi:MAG: hypothetical protein JW807_03295 [Spirochaetes bacterium]|nr:hypothetical protein [Spirochaetota bacterium]